MSLVRSFLLISHPFPPLNQNMSSSPCHPPPSQSPQPALMIDAIASWNIRGSNNPSKQSDVKDYIRKQKLGLIAILENKLSIQTIYYAMNNMCPGWSFHHNLEHAPFGRIIVAWNPDLFVVTPLHSDWQCCHYNVYHAQCASSFMCTVVYASNSLHHRLAFLANLHTLQPQRLPWILMGD